MASELKSRLQTDMTAAMKAADKQRLGTIRMALSEIKQREIDQRTDLDDDQVIVVLDKMVKQRRDSQAQFEAAGRSDLAATEAAEIEVLQEYLPQALEADELEQLVRATIDAVGGESMRDMGKVMAALRPQVQGRADMGRVSQLVKTRLQPPG